MKSYLPLLFAFLFIVTTNKLAAQTAAPLPKSMHILKANPRAVWYSHERNIAPQFTFNMETGLIMTYRLSAFYSSTPLDFGIIPALRLQGRWYYNLHKRQEEGKNTLHYSANYLTLETGGIPGVVLPEEASRSIALSVSVVPMWGMRRSLGDKFVFEGAAGYGVYFTPDEIRPGPGFDLNIGYIF